MSINITRSIQSTHDSRLLLLGDTILLELGVVGITVADAGEVEAFFAPVSVRQAL